MARRRVGVSHLALVALALCACGTDDTALAGPPRVEITRPIQRVRRLSAREYDNAVRDLLGDASHPSIAFPADALTNGYDNGSADLTVQSDQLVAYQAAAERLAASMVPSQLDRLTGCAAAPADVAPCLARFFGPFLTRAFRRPPSELELHALRGVYDTAATLGGYALGVQTTLEAILQSPAFLYRGEIGDASAARGGIVRLGPYELASELSFLITGSMPDDALLEAAANGRLTTDADVRREASRLLSLPTARASFRSFLAQWFATTRVGSITRDPAFYPTFTPELARAMATDLDLYYDDVITDGDGSLYTLFTSRSAFVDARLASLYGVAPPMHEFQRVTLDGMSRGGILTRAGFLAARSAVDSSAPIQRGVFIRDAILCVPTPPPPANVLAQSHPTPPAPHETTRQHVDVHATQPACVGCHRLIDGVGFGLEEDDAIGALRSTDNGAPVDTRGELIGLGERFDGPFAGGTQLDERIARSPALQQCYVRQLYRFAMGSSETELDRNTLRELGHEVTADTRMSDAFLTLAAMPTFLERRRED